MSEILVNPTEFGIEESKAGELIGNLPQIKAERTVLEQQFKEVITLDIEDKETSKKAKQLRLLIAKNRTQGINVWHKTTKDFFLKGGQFVDAIKRMEIAINEKMESDLEQIEKYAEIQEQKRINELRSQRVSELEDYKEFVPFGIDLGIISDVDFTNLKNGAILQFNAKIEAEQKVEAERIANEKAEKERIENQRIENEKLKAEKERLEKLAEIERKKQAEILAKQKAESEKLAKIEDEKQAKIKAELDAKFEAERKEKEKLEAELKAKKDAEIEAEKQRLETEKLAKIEAEKLAKAPVKEKMKVWVNSFEISTIDFDNEKTKEIQDKFNSFKNWALNQIEKL